MYQTMSLPLYSGSFEEYHGWGDLRAELAALGCDGMEGIWSGEEFPEDLPADLVIGYHLTFYPDWLDFYRDDRRALKRKFGSLDAAARFYGGPGPETLLEQYRADLRRAAGLNPHYVVFHVSDVSIEEGYIYHWLHTNQEVIDAAVEVINLILGTETWPFEFLGKPVVARLYVYGAGGNRPPAGGNPFCRERDPAGYRTPDECLHRAEE